MAVEVGQQAPPISLYDDEKQAFDLSDCSGKKVVILFYPGAFTGVCTNEMNEVSNDIAEYGSNTEIVGISTDSPFTLAEFKKVNQIKFRLLSDHDAVVSAAWGVKHDNDFTDMGLGRISKRSAFVVDENGQIIYAEVTPNPGVLPDLEKIKTVAAG